MNFNTIISLFYVVTSCVIVVEQQQTTEQFTEPISRPFEHHQQEEVVIAIVVEAGRVECVYQKVEAQKYQSFEVVYQVSLFVPSLLYFASLSLKPRNQYPFSSLLQVIDGGDLDITFSLKSPLGYMIVHEQRKTDGTHQIKLDDQLNGRGDYALCFDNTFSYTSAKRVFFEIFLLDKDGNYLNDYDMKAIQKKHGGLLAEQLETFNSVTIKVKSNLNEIERMQSQFRAIEARDRALVETAFERINFWSSVNLLCLLFAGGVQVYMLRSLFIDDSRMGRFVRHGKLN